MTRKLIFRAIIALLVLAPLAGRAQSITGTTNISVSNSGQITATCETDLDADTQAYYEGIVSCVIKDGDGNEKASGQYTDHNGFQGYALVTLNFAGSPGTAYIATGQHGAVIDYGQDQPSPVPGQPPFYSYLDYYNYSQYESNPNTVYPSFYQWPGPGPEQQRRASSISIGDTTSSKVYPIDTVLLATYAEGDFASLCDKDFSAVIGSGYSKSSFFSSLQGTTFYQYPDGTPGTPDHSGSVDADTLYDQSGRPIELFPNFYGPANSPTTRSFREFVIIHEGVHHYTGWSDAQVFTNFYNSGLRHPTGQTNDFTVWLTNGCPKS